MNILKGVQLEFCCRIQEKESISGYRMKDKKDCWYKVMATIREQLVVKLLVDNVTVYTILSDVFFFSE